MKKYGGIIMENVKIYARQINPDYQDANIFDDDMYTDIIVKGNNSFGEHNTDLLDIIDDISEDIYNFAESENITDFAAEADYEKVAEWLSDHYSTEKHPHWTVEELKRFIVLADTAINSALKGYSKVENSPENCNATMLSIYTGEKWETSTISGCCQSDWQTIYYSTEAHSDKDIEIFESGYFNTGTEWVIHDDDYIPESPEDISGCSLYCYSYKPREEIAETLGVMPEDIVMYKIEMCYTPVYSKMA